MCGRIKTNVCSATMPVLAQHLIGRSRLEVGRGDGGVGRWGRSRSGEHEEGRSDISRVRGCRFVQFCRFFLSYLSYE